MKIIVYLLLFVLVVSGVGFLLTKVAKGNKKSEKKDKDIPPDDIYPLW